MQVAKNSVHEVEFTGYTSEGLGVARLDGLVVFVPGVIRGERWKIRLEKVGKTVAWGRGTTLLHPSLDRRPLDCPHASLCGGCQYRHMSYEEELRAKRQKVDDALQRVGGLELSVSAILGAEHPERYRNKVQFPVSAGKKGPRVGFFRFGSHDVVDVKDCLLQPKEAGQAAEVLRRWMNRRRIPAYDEARHCGLVRHLFLRFASSGILCCLVVNAPEGERLPWEHELVWGLRSIPGLTGLTVNFNTAKTNVILGEKYRLLFGQDWLEDTLCNLTFRISAPSFYQVNHDQCQVLYRKEAELAGLTGTETVLDLYCGAGTIALTMAGQAGRVIGAEIVPEAIEDAKANAARNAVSNAEFFCGDAGAIARKLAEEGTRPDVICVDPPRKGLSSDVIDAAVRMAPKRIVYVSCNPATLARDLKIFAGQGYAAREAVAVDMFPRTAHVETVCLLTPSERPNPQTA